MRAVILTVLSLVSQITLAVQTGPVAAPALTAKQFVYTVPPDYDPPLIGKTGLQAIQNTAAALHNPFYVVIIANLPPLTAAMQSDAVSKQYTQRDAELRATYAVDKLAEDLAANNLGYDIETSSIFLLSYEPRQFRVLSGARWKRDLGLERQQLDPYLNIFRQSVTGTPKDPKGGIIRMITAYDNDVFERVDPAKIAARQEQARLAQVKARIAAEQEQLQASRGQLDEQTLLLTETLKVQKYLPPNPEAYVDLLNKALHARQEDNQVAMNAVTNEMRPSVRLLQGYVQNQRSEEIDRTLAFAFAVFVLLAALAAVTIVLRLRWNRYVDTVKRTNSLIATWRRDIASAAGNYLEAYAKRDSVVAMKDTTGETKALWDSVTAEVDDIWIGVMAIKEHVETCAKIAGKASFFNIQPATAARKKLGSPFDFATGLLNKDELFAPPTKVVTIDPVPFKQTLQARYSKNREQWALLERALDARLSNAVALFPHRKMTELLDFTDKHGIPQRWLSDHPLAGDGASDQSVWAALDAIQWSDPIAYLERIAELHRKEAAVVARVDKIAAAQDSIQSASSQRGSVSIPAGVNISPDTDPSVSLNSARAETASFPAVLAQHADSKNTDAVTAAADKILNLYRKARDQNTVLQQAIRNIVDVREAVKTAINKAEHAQASAYTRLEAARKVHSNLSDAQEAFEAGSKLLADAQSYCTTVTQKYLLQEQENKIRGRSRATDALRLFNESIAYCAAKDDERQKFIDRTNDLNRKYTHAKSEIQRYKGETYALKAPVVPVTPVNAPQDYNTALLAVVAQEHVWESHTREARNNYEDAQARSRASSYDSGSSYSSSSSSSYDSGSSSSGGDYGGGGSSSGGGDW